MHKPTQEGSWQAAPQTRQHSHSESLSGSILGNRLKTLSSTRQRKANDGSWGGDSAPHENATTTVASRETREGRERGRAACSSETQKPKVRLTFDRQFQVLLLCNQ